MLRLVRTCRAAGTLQAHRVSSNPGTAQRCNISRFPERTPGAGRLVRRKPRAVSGKAQDDPKSTQDSFADVDPHLQDSDVRSSLVDPMARERPLGDPAESLKALLSRDTLLVTRYLSSLTV